MKRYISACVLGVLLQSSAHAGLFSDYSTDSTAFRSALHQPLSEPMLVAFTKKEKSNDKVLFLMEKARLLQTARQYQASKDAYDAAFAVINEQEGRAKISASRTGLKALSLISNETAIPYLVPDYEKVLAHIYQAVNYIALNDTEGAAVEMRAAQAKQREIELSHTTEEDKATQKADQQSTQQTTEQAPEQANTSTPEQTEKYEEAFKGLDPIVAKVKNTYQNAYAFYMAATLWEALGETNDALVDYKKAYELQPDPAIKRDIARLEKGKTVSKSATFPVVVWVEQGLVPNKVPNTLALPTTNGLINLSFATYDPATYTAPQPLDIQMNGKSQCTTYAVSDIGALAVKALKERAMGDMTRQVLRSATKYAVQREVGNRFGFLGQLAANAYNTASDKADLRAWSTLPSNAQVGRFYLPAGTHQLTIKDGGVEQNISVDVAVNQTTILHVMDSGSVLDARVFPITIGGGAVAQPNTPTALSH